MEDFFDQTKFMMHSLVLLFMSNFSQARTLSHLVKKGHRAPAMPRPPSSGARVVGGVTCFEKAFVLPATVLGGIPRGYMSQKPISLVLGSGGQGLGVQLIVRPFLVY